MKKNVIQSKCHKIVTWFNIAILLMMEWRSLSLWLYDSMASWLYGSVHITSVRTDCWQKKKTNNSNRQVENRICKCYANKMQINLFMSNWEKVYNNLQLSFGPITKSLACSVHSIIRINEKWITLSNVRTSKKKKMKRRKKSKHKRTIYWPYFYRYATLTETKIRWAHAHIQMYKM